MEKRIHNLGIQGSILQDEMAFEYHTSYIIILIGQCIFWTNYFWSTLSKPQMGGPRKEEYKIGTWHGLNTITYPLR